MKIQKLNQSFTSIPAFEAIRQILTVEREGWQFDYMVRIGRKDKYERFYTHVNQSLIVANGVLELPAIKELLKIPESLILEALYDAKTMDELRQVLNSTPLTDGDIQLLQQTQQSIQEMDEVIATTNLPFKPREYQQVAAIKALTKKITLLEMCTGSGKSLTISLLLEYFRRKNLKGALIVPNINLLTQFYNDIDSYNLKDVLKNITRLGGSFKNQPNEDTQFLLTTWQSLKNIDENYLKSLDFIICDEVHRFSSECTSNLVLSSINCQYKIGLTGTLPEAKTSKMILLGLFGIPFGIIRSKDLIDEGQGTPIEINQVKIKHQPYDSFNVCQRYDYLEKVKYLIDIPKRTELIARLSKKLSGNHKGSVLVLYTLIDHGTKIYQEITGELPGSLERQKELKVFFMEGSVKASEREEMRQLMDSTKDAVMVANYSLLSTGVNIKSLRYCVFAAPLKSYTVIVQSLGRGIRTIEGKDKFEVYDLCDVIEGTYTFSNSAKKRRQIYQEQGFTIKENTVQL